MSTHIPNETKIAVYELCVNGKSLFEEFFTQIENTGNLMASLASAIRIVEDTANLQLRPKNKFRLIVGHTLTCKIYEAKSGSIRIYLFHEENTGRIIVTGGLKDDQEKDINSIKKIIKEYYNEK